MKLAVLRTEHQKLNEDHEIIVDGTHELIDNYTKIENDFNERLKQVEADA